MGYMLHRQYSHPPFPARRISPRWNATTLPPQWPKKKSTTLYLPDRGAVARQDSHSAIRQQHL